MISGSKVEASDTATHLNYESSGGTLIKPLDPLLPDPTKPVAPIDPTDPSGPAPGTGGSLSLDFASSFQFGQQAISTTDEIYYAKTQEYITSDGTKAAGPNYIQVSDIRGTGSGWRLAVKQTTQFQTTDGQLLKGAELSFQQGELVSNLSADLAPTALLSFTLPINSEIDVITAQSEKGMGTWLYRFGSDATTGAKAISLHVPGKTVKYAKQYQTALTWTLKNVP